MTEAVSCCRRFSPIVGLEPTDRESILLDITGLAHLFGGETALGEAIVRDLGRRGLAARVAIADTIGAAWAVARSGRGKAEGGRGTNEERRIRNEEPPTRSSSIPIASSSSPFRLPPSPFLIIPPHEAPTFLTPLPIEALRLPAETVRLLHELGIARIGQLEALPRRELSSRFGPMPLVRLDQAFGRLPEPVPVCRTAPRFAADWSAEYPTSRRETICAA